MIIIVFVPLLVIAAVVAAVQQRRHGRIEPIRFVRSIALGLAIVFVVFGGLFIAGETFDDPGGWTAAVLVASWLVPMAVLAALARWWPQPACWILAALVAIVVAVGAWYAVDPDGWRSFEDGHGPVRAVAVFAMTLPLAVLAWKRPVFGGALLVGLAVAPGALALLSTGGGGAAGSTVGATSPAALVGVLYLVVGWLEREQAARKSSTPDSSATTH